MREEDADPDMRLALLANAASSQDDSASEDDDADSGSKLAGDSDSDNQDDDQDGRRHHGAARHVELACEICGVSSKANFVHRRHRSSRRLLGLTMITHAYGGIGFNQHLSTYHACA